MEQPDALAEDVRAFLPSRLQGAFVSAIDDRVRRGRRPQLQSRAAGSLGDEPRDMRAQFGDAVATRPTSSRLRIGGDMLAQAFERRRDRALRSAAFTSSPLVSTTASTRRRRARASSHDRSLEAMPAVDEHDTRTSDGSDGRADSRAQVGPGRGLRFRHRSRSRTRPVHQPRPTVEIEEEDEPPACGPACATCAQARRGRSAH